MTISCFAQDGIVRIVVEDTGPGIPAEHVPHLFERFYRVPSGSQGIRGTGLGLYICRKIVEAHRGDIGVESRIGEGTRFSFTLPVHQPQPVPEGVHEQ